MNTDYNEKQRKKSAPKRIFSEKKRAQKGRQREMTHEERKVKLPKNDPEFVYRKMTATEKDNDKLVQKLKPIKSSRALWKMMKSLELNKSQIPPDDLEERYGPIEYHPEYEGISAEATLARRKPFWTDQKRTNEW